MGLVGPNSLSVVHSIPGRVRLRVGSGEAEAGEKLARALAARHDVRKVAWNPRAYSLTVHYEPSSELGELAACIGSSRAPRVESTIGRGGEVDWGRLGMNCLLALLPVGPLGGLAVALLSLLPEEPRKPTVTRRSRGSEISPSYPSPDHRLCDRCGHPLS